MESVVIQPVRATRPSVTLSYAQSLDGSIASATGDTLLLSGPESLALTHELRAFHDAVLIGIGTLLADNPRLTVRLAPGTHPQPIVADSRLRFPLDVHLLQSPAVPPWIATTDQADSRHQATLEAAGARVWRLPPDDTNRVDLRALLQLLADQGIKRLMVEGGSQIISSFLVAGLVDSLVITITPKFIGGLPAIAPCATGLPTLRNVRYETLGNDLIVRADVAAPE